MGFLDSLKPFAHWFLRLPLAGVFIFHGLTKFPMAEQMASMMNFPLFVVYGLAIAEVVAGIFIVLGAVVGNDLFTRISGFIISVVMIGAITMVHWGQWSFMASETHPMGGMEFQVVLMTIALYFLVKGNHDLDSDM